MVDNDSGQSFTGDSETIIRALGNLNGSRSISPLGNPLTGLGTDRDPSNYTQVLQTYNLTDEEASNLFMGSRIAKNIVSVYPMEASWAQFTFGTEKYKKYSSYSQKATDFFENLKTGSLHRKFIEVSIEARTMGEAYLLLGCEDGQSYDKPINENNIQSFDWTYVIPKTKVESVYNKPGYYLINLKSDRNSPISKDKILVHESRLRLFVGDYVPQSILEKRKYHASSLQSAFDGLTMGINSILAANAMLQDHSPFYYKLDGLAQLVKLKKMDELYSRFLALQMSKSVLRGMAIDMRTEDIGYANRSYGGVDTILDTMIDYMVAESGLVRYKVLGSSQDTGLGGEGRGLQDRLQHSLNIKSYQFFNWYDHLKYILRLACLAKTGITKGKLPARGMGIIFPPVIELTPEEIVNLQKTSIEMSKTAIDAGILNQLEVRFALFSSNEPVLIPNYTLDDRYTQQLEERIYNTDQNTNQVNTEEPNPEPEEDDTEELLDDLENDSGRDRSANNSRTTTTNTNE